MFDQKVLDKKVVSAWAGETVVFSKEELCDLIPTLVLINKGNKTEEYKELVRLYGESDSPDAADVRLCSINLAKGLISRSQEADKMFRKLLIASSRKVIRKAIGKFLAAYTRRERKVEGSR